MPIESPVHQAVAPYCKSMRWKDWAGYYAVSSFEPCHEREYVAFRNAVGMIDVSPLFKYDITGKDAAAFLARVVVKDVTKLKLGQVTYCCWCDDQGKIIDDGTITRLAEDEFRLTAAEPSLAWLYQFSHAFDVVIEDTTTTYAALSVQGPNSRMALNECVDANLDELRFFRCVETKIAGEHGWVSRTGYTGDLGFEVWIESAKAAQVYNTIMEAGAPFGIRACGLDALDVTRIEAGFVMNGVEYFSANHCISEVRKSSPYELGLGWCINLDRDTFIGQEALQRENQAGPKRQFVGLEINWHEIEAEFARYDLPPEICNQAWRDGRPIYNQTGDFIGQGTSGTWSPILKKNIALAIIDSRYAEPGQDVKIEVTVEYRRVPMTAKVVKTPFYNPPQKRSMP